MFTSSPVLRAHASPVCCRQADSSEDGGGDGDKGFGLPLHAMGPVLANLAQGNPRSAENQQRAKHDGRVTADALYLGSTLLFNGLMDTHWRNPP